MLDVIQWPDERLGKVATEVPHGEKCRELIDQMFEAMDYPKGIGLAAPQIGVDKRIIVIRVPAVKNGKMLGSSTKVHIINPVLEWWKGGPKLDWDGCLSFPGKQVLVPRFQRVKVRGFSLRWEPIVIGGHDLVARVLQHEIDHLNGKTLAYYEALAEQITKEEGGSGPSAA
jgi:peptide deformylase